MSGLNVESLTVIGGFTAMKAAAAVAIVRLFTECIPQAVCAGMLAVHTQLSGQELGLVVASMIFSLLIATLGAAKAVAYLASQRMEGSGPTIEPAVVGAV